MAFIDRFLGRKDQPAGAGELHKPASPGIGLAALFAGPLPMDQRRLAVAIQRHHASLQRATVEVGVATPEAHALALVGWGAQQVRIVAFNQPIPPEVLEVCVAPAHYGAEQKAQARAHQSHALLYYSGQESEVLAQYQALALIAGAFASLGCVAILNEAAHTSVPGSFFKGEGDALQLVQSLPLLMLYCGFVKYEVEGTDGVWMRTYGNQLFGLPNFARLSAGHHQGTETMETFTNIMMYMLKSGAKMAPGHTMQVGNDLFMKLRAPTAAEYFLRDGQPMLVAELIRQSQINR